MLRVADDFLNIRGSFKVGGLLEIGTQCSLVRRANGRFVFLDSYTLSGAVQREVDALTSGGKDVEAILNLHPFHTVHVRAMHQRFPSAELYGTARHLSRFPDLPWQKTRTEQTRLHNLFEEDSSFRYRVASTSFRQTRTCIFPRCLCCIARRGRSMSMTP